MQTLTFQKIKLPMAGRGQESSLPDLLGISVLQNELKFDLDEHDEIYEGYGRTQNMYPYRQYDNYCRDLKTVTTEAAILENDFLKAVFLTEYGGRLWELWDKKRGKNLLYTNDVLRFSNLASRNAWFSGGVEWNIGVIGHCPFTTEALHIAKTQTPEGFPVLRMYQYERIRKVTWQMDFWLNEDPHLNCAMRIYNENTEVIPMYWWSNIAVPEHDGGRVIVPAHSAYTNAHGLVYKVNIPFVDGIDITDYQKIPYSVDYFFDIPENAPKYIANVDADGYGLLHISSARLRSRKLFSWGHQTASVHWQQFLTDHQGPYIEIQAGLGKTQYGCIPMAPHTTWEWTERYGAVQIPPEDLKISHADREKHLTDAILSRNIAEELEALSRQGSCFAKKEACLIRSGRQHGALAATGKNTAHLRFDLDSESLLKWQSFFQNGILHEPAPDARPDEFMIGAEHVEFMERACRKKENENNWYAYYHLGLGYFEKSDFIRAIHALERSDALVPNPWARHALSCAHYKLNNHDESVKNILEGMRMCQSDISYLKEGFRILMQNEAFHAICNFYKTLDRKLKEISKLKYYYIAALAKTGKGEAALSLLEKNGGIVMEDTREGENSLQELWEELNQRVSKGTGAVPYIYNFRTTEP